ncbi:hypothetical protein F5I97DRAFT_385432 [Phlebopus sp. FC_14]|nr:hypothetical protein F5I97DRAFT_385432 [Phlebopus sp. FC_14]
MMARALTGFCLATIRPYCKCRPEAARAGAVHTVFTAFGPITARKKIRRKRPRSVHSSTSTLPSRPSSRLAPLLAVSRPSKPSLVSMHLFLFPPGDIIIYRNGAEGVDLEYTVPGNTYVHVHVCTKSTSSNTAYPYNPIDNGTIALGLEGSKTLIR